MTGRNRTFPDEFGVADSCRPARLTIILIAYTVLVMAAVDRSGELSMYVCLCNGVTDRQIREAVCDGVKSMRQLRQCLGVAANCGRCAPHAKELLDESRAEQRFEGQLSAA